MFKPELEIKEKEEIIAILDGCTCCRIGLIADGRPYILPMAFGYDWDKELVLYFHCGLSGRKNTALRSNPIVSFEMDIEGEMIGADRPAHLHSRAFQSLMGEGTVSFAKNEQEKRKGFSYIMKHQTGVADWDIAPAYLATAEVFSIKATSFRAAKKDVPSGDPLPHIVLNFDQDVCFDASHG